MTPTPIIINEKNRKRSEEMKKNEDLKMEERYPMAPSRRNERVDRGEFVGERDKKEWTQKHRHTGRIVVQLLR